MASGRTKDRTQKSSPLRHTAATWQEASWNLLTLASSTGAEEGGAALLWSAAAPAVPSPQLPSFYSALPKWKPQHASEPSTLRGAGGSHRSLGHLTSACVGDAVHCPLHVSLILSVAQNQALLPACQSPVDRAQSVSECFLWAAL